MSIVLHNTELTLKQVIEVFNDAGLNDRGMPLLVEVHYVTHTSKIAKVHRVEVNRGLCCSPKLHIKLSDPI